MVSSYSDSANINVKKGLWENGNVKLEGLTLVLLLAVTSAVFGSSTQFGFNTGVINNPKEVSPCECESLVKGYSPLLYERD